MKIQYIRVGDYYIPDLTVPEESRPIGRWGRMHREYLKEHKPIQYKSRPSKKRHISLGKPQFSPIILSFQHKKTGGKSPYFSLRDSDGKRIGSRKGPATFLKFSNPTNIGDEPPGQKRSRAMDENTRRHPQSIMVPLSRPLLKK